jgi:cell division protein FtsI (penicillin-binding protein 3)
MTEEKKIDIKKDILWRVYLVHFGLCLFGIAIIVQIFRIQYVQGAYWAAKSDSLTTELRNIEPKRGNIYSDDGGLMAISIPTYEVRMDVNAQALTNDIWNKNIDSLALSLSNLFKDKNKLQYLNDLNHARKKGERYYLIQKSVSYDFIKELSKFPMFRMGRYKGGLITPQRMVREKPCNQLAERTIGYPGGEGRIAVGIEGAFDTSLAGVSGKRLEQRVSNGVWKPVYDENALEPKDGNDIITTIDINIQDVAEKALKTNLEKNKAEYGCVIVMDVTTGEIKAIANLKRNKNDEYEESLNYAISESTEPGSTFKLISMIAAMDDGLVDLNDIVNTGNGKLNFSGSWMNDAHDGGYGTLTAQHAFEVSSNVGISKLISSAYSKNPEAFIDKIYKMKVNQPLGLQISGEITPDIKDTKDPRWSGISLPWMSIGYELRLTPLQILAFYNAVANNGKMMKPFLVKEVRDRGKVIRKFEPIVITDSICSLATIKKAKQMLDGVVERGTARNLRDSSYRIAGKTGTAQRSMGKGGYKLNDKANYQASFVGYFPADNPKYSCIAVVYSPSTEVYYGASVAGPIFKEISDKVYSTRLEMHKDEVSPTVVLNDRLPSIQTGNQKDIVTVCNSIGITTIVHNNTTDWVQVSKQNNLLNLTEKHISNGLVPNVIGMELKDAVYILENVGLSVKIKGKGSVIKQSIEAGQPIGKGKEIIIDLS